MHTFALTKMTRSVQNPFVRENSIGSTTKFTFGVFKIAENL